MSDDEIPTSIEETARPSHDLPLPATLRTACRDKSMADELETDDARALKILFAADVWADWIDQAARALGVKRREILAVVRGTQPLSRRQVDMLLEMERGRRVTLARHRVRVNERLDRAEAILPQGGTLLRAIKAERARDPGIFWRDREARKATTKARRAVRRQAQAGRPADEQGRRAQDRDGRGRFTEMAL